MIKASLDAVDRHNDHYLRTNNYKHLVAAHYLRQYVSYVKDLILEVESINNIKEPGAGQTHP
jgi:hypothetical protein